MINEPVARFELSLPAHKADPVTIMLHWYTIIFTSSSFGIQCESYTAEIWHTYTSHHTPTHINLNASYCLIFKNQQ